MAVLWPRRLPREIRENPLRSAERTVYQRLAASLDDRWSVFYSRPWLGLSPTGEEIDGEADFIVAHPDEGFLALEVKGGRIDRDPTEDRWTSTDRHGVTRRIKDPIAQARTAKHRIIEKLQESPHWRPRRIRIRHGVVFPDVTIPARDLGPDMPRRLFCDRDELEGDFRAWLLARFRAPEDRDPAGDVLGDDGMRALTKLLAEPFTLRVPLGYLTEDDERDLEVLTQQQYQVLATLEEIPRAAVRGGAGTGKTVLALESARRLAEGGKRTLLTCYNRALAHRLRAMSGGGHDIDSFHSLCRRMSGAAGLAVAQGIPEKELYEDVLPDLLARSAEARPELRYDAIVVDEGQDFRPHWWVAIDALLRPGGRLQVFYDANQRVYRDISALPRDIEAVPVPLSQNLRNTRAIHAVSMRYYSGYPTHPNDVEGIPVEAALVLDSASFHRAVGEVVRRLVEVERVPPEQIAAIASSEGLCGRIAPERMVGRFATCSCDESRQGAVILDTIRRFKGLEARVVVLVASGDLVRDEELLYVATSRPRAHLVVVGEREALGSLGVASPD